MKVGGEAYAKASTVSSLQITFSATSFKYIPILCIMKVYLLLFTCKCYF